MVERRELLHLIRRSEGDLSKTTHKASYGEGKVRFDKWWVGDDTDEGDDEDEEVNK